MFQNHFIVELHDWLHFQSWFNLFTTEQSVIFSFAICSFVFPNTTNKYYLKEKNNIFLRLNATLELVEVTTVVMFMSISMQKSVS